MIRALGYSENRFDPKDPGRLCRGRERWIEPWEIEGGAPVLHRIVVSGATFSDDGASDARRGLPFSGVELADVIEALYPGAPLVAFMEDGHPADIPPDAQGVEAYEGYRAGGRQELGLVRWYLPLGLPEENPIPPESGSTPFGLRELLSGGLPEERVRGIVVLGDEPVDLPDLMQRTFELVGFSTLDSPPARYQPSALPDVLALAKAVIVLHRDKHGPALAVYANEPVTDLDRKLATLADHDVLLVPFAIPPMLARWDRALAELRSHWDRPTPFPVPAAPPAPPESRGRRFRYREDDDEVEPLAEAVVPPAADDGGEE
jgi:hypothetical protein